jgi:hypothetical protein
MANTRLSYSQIRTYGECGQKYKYSYIDRLREKVKSGALFFGTAFDQAIEAVLQNRGVDEKAVFDKAFTNQNHNSRTLYLPDSIDVVYAASDYDYDLLTAEDKTFLVAKAKELLPKLFVECSEDIKELYGECAKFKKQRAFRHFRKEENQFLNLCCWFSMRRKGHIMLDAHRKEVLPKITKVVGTQTKIDLVNSDGDSLIGYVDLIGHWMGEDEPTVIDYKTSASEYEADSVLTSPQLSIYCHALGLKKAGYIVFRKGILKNKVKICSVCGLIGTGSRAKTCTNDATGERCGGAWDETIKPECDIQIIMDKIPERTEQIVLENIDSSNRGIKAGIFSRNFNSCGNFGGCPYKGKCFKDSDEGLEQM